MISLQTSCYKEKTQNAENLRKGPSPIFSQNHEEVINFHSEFQKWQNEEPYSHYDLSVSDAEWILEAALNYKYRFTEDDADGSYALITYTNEEDPLAEIVDHDASTGKIAAEDLFQNFEQLSNSTDLLDVPAPAHDVWIDTEGEDLVMHAFTAVISSRAPFSFYDRIPFEHPLRAISYTAGGPGGGPTLPICNYPYGTNTPAYDQFTHNLRASHAVFLMQTGTYFANVEDWNYPEDANITSDYIGYQTSDDHSLDIWGATTNANPNTTSTGSPYQCLSVSELQGYESGMKSVLNNEISSSHQSISVKVTDEWSYTYYPNNPNWYDSYHHFHRVSFRDGVLLP